MIYGVEKMIRIRKRLKISVPVMVIPTLFLYRLLIDICYYFILSPLFNYGGFIAKKNITVYIISWFFTLVPLPFIYQSIKSRRPTDCIMMMLINISFIPTTVLFAFGVVTTEYMIYCTFYWFVFLLFHWVLGRIKIYTVKISKNIRCIMIFLITVISAYVVLYLAWKYTNFRFSFHLYEVYELRTQAEGYKISTLISYLLGISCAVVPAIIGYLIIEKKFLPVLVLFFIQLLNFGINGLKSTFFMMLITIIASLFYKSNYKKYIQLGFIGFTVCCILEYIVSNTVYIIDFILRRVFFVSSQLSYYYYDFFRTHPPDFFKTSFLRHFGFQSEYSNIPYLIGEIYYHKDVSANCGLIADAVMNLGAWNGLLIYPLLLALLMKLLDISVNGLEDRLYIVAFIYIAYVLLNATLFTALLSHGIIMLIILLFLFPRNAQKTL